MSPEAWNWLVWGCKLLLRFCVSAGHPLLEIHYLFLKVKNLGQKCDKRISFSTILDKTLTTTKTFLSTLGIAKIFPFLHTVYKRRSILIWVPEGWYKYKHLDFRWPSIMAMWIQSKNKTESMLLELVCSNSKHPYIPICGYCMWITSNYSDIHIYALC